MANFVHMGYQAIEIGDKVRFLNEVGEGTVTQILSSTHAMVEDQDGFEFQHALRELIRVDDREEESEGYARVIPSVAEILAQEVSSQEQKAIEKEFKERYVEANNRPVSNDTEEVDLHMHQLVDSQRGLTAPAMLELQLAHFERMLLIGIRQKTKRMVFIHGIGQGVLRHEIWSRIEQFYPDCTCRSADPRRFGNGATEVWIGESAFSRRSR
tara:strand:- start:2413 stop:3048 length:636 start_codon:yes stop_codon:yes gene_type:complete